MRQPSGRSPNSAMPRAISSLPSSGCSGLARVSSSSVARRGQVVDLVEVDLRRDAEPVPARAPGSASGDQPTHPADRIARRGWRRRSSARRDKRRAIGSAAQLRCACPAPCALLDRRAMKRTTGQDRSITAQVAPRDPRGARRHLALRARRDQRGAVPHLGLYLRRCRRPSPRASPARPRA